MIYFQEPDMIVIPRETPVVSSLHTSYIKIRPFIDHFRSSLPAGCVYMRATSFEGAVFFHNNHLVNAWICKDGEPLKRQEALTALIASAEEGGQTISVYEIASETLYYWANLNEAALVHSNLTSSTINMEALLKKITQDKFTGLIEVLNGHGRVDQLHVIVGEIAGAVLGKTRGILRDPDHELAQIIANAKNARTRIAIKRVQMDMGQLDDTLLLAPQDLVPNKDEHTPQANPIEMLEALLRVFESTYRKHRDQKDPFDTALKRKFLEKVGEYDFLDPFTSEFYYQDGSITYTGSDSLECVVAAVTECLRELSLEKGIGMEFQQSLKGWRQTYHHEIDLFKAII